MRIMGIKGIKGIKGAGETARSVLGKPSASHPHAHAPTPGAQGFWVVQVKPGPPLGWVISRSVGNGPRYHCYAYCRDQEDKRPWLREFSTLNSAVAWRLQHEAGIRDLISSCSPEPSSS
jgi:hypothetical protein